MGMCLPCLGGSSADYGDPDPEIKRQQIAEAAEKRCIELDKKGIKDPEALKQKQKKREELEKKSENNGGQEAGLRWQVG